MSAGRDGVSTGELKANLQALLRERRRITAGATDDFSVMDMKEISNTVSGATSILTDLLSAVAGISLLVGGIGIMNHHAGLGDRTDARDRHQARGRRAQEPGAEQFLIEAVVLSMLGGVAGIGLGLGLSGIAVHYLKVPFIISPGTIALAFLFSAAVGVVFGLLPARRAAISIRSKRSGTNSDDYSAATRCGEARPEMPATSPNLRKLLTNRPTSFAAWAS